MAFAEDALRGPSRNSDPASDYFAITPSDTVNFTQGPCRAIYVGVGGNIVAIKYDGVTAVTFTGVTAGSILPIVAKRVNNTNTTATNMVALY